jgi:hypothetical protein
MFSASQSRAMGDRSSLLGRQSGGLVRGLFSTDVGDTLEKAKNVPTIKRGGSFKRSGDVGGKKDLDFYKVKFNAATQFSVRVENEDRKNDRDPITFSILDSKGMAMTGTTPFSQVVKAGKTKTLSAQLEAGTYYVKFECLAGKNQDYKMRLSSDA